VVYRFKIVYIISVNYWHRNLKRSLISLTTAYRRRKNAQFYSALWMSARIRINENEKTRDFLLRSHPYFASRVLRPYVTWLASPEGVSAREAAATQLLTQAKELGFGHAHLESLLSPGFVAVACKAILRAAALTMRQVALKSGLISEDSFGQYAQDPGAYEDVRSSVSVEGDIRLDTLTLAELNDALRSGLYSSRGLKAYGYGHLDQSVWKNALVPTDDHDIETEEQFMAQWLVLGTITLTQESFIQTLLDSIADISDELGESDGEGDASGPDEDEDEEEDEDAGGDEGVAEKSESNEVKSVSGKSKTPRELKVATVRQITLLERLFAEDYYSRCLAVYTQSEGGDDSGEFIDPLILELEAYLGPAPVEGEPEASISEKSHLKLFGFEPMTPYLELSQQHLRRKFYSTIGESKAARTRPLGADPNDAAATCAMLTHAYVRVVTDFVKAQVDLEPGQQEGSEAKEPSPAAINTLFDSFTRQLQIVHVALQTLFDDVSDPVLASTPEDITARVLPALGAKVCSEQERERWSKFVVGQKSDQGELVRQLASLDENGNPAASLVGMVDALIKKLDSYSSAENLVAARLPSFRKLTSDVVNSAHLLRKRISYVKR